MPANLTPEYLAAEDRLRQAKSVQEKVAALQDMLSVVPKHKGTDKLRGQLRSKLSKLREESQKRRTTGRSFYLFNVQKEGAGQILLVGLPNSGKSTLLSRLTNASTEIAEYPFTTRVPVVGMMDFENIQIQLIDAPAVTLELGEAWFTNLARNADALVLTIDLGGDVSEQMRTILDKLSETGITPIGDGVSSSVSEKRTIIVGTKADLPGAQNQGGAFQKACGKPFPIVFFSAPAGIGLEPLRRNLFDMLNIIRIYSKIPGKEVDYSMPFVLPRESSVEDMARLVHKDFSRRLRFARVWGSGKFSGQKVRKSYILGDKDVVELHV
jgi:ribosome-interacting GTPase 1